MDDRGQESPMDFQWDNSSGKVDPNSPFRMIGIERTHAQETPVKKGTQSTFQSSPIKQPVFSTPGPTTTFAPASPFRKPPPQPTFQNPAFTTPRWGYSKDSDTFSTPGDALDTDSEAPTPDAKIAQLLLSGRKGGISSLTLASNRVSGRGELRRGGRHDGAISKPRRRRNRRTEVDRTSDDEESEEEETDYTSRPKSSHPRSPDWLYTHQSLPAVLSGYLQLFIHASWVALTVYILFACFRVVRDDMDHRVQEAASEVVAQIANCNKNYVQNHCAPNIRVPAMEHACTEWERCMNQDPAKVGRAKVSAATIAEILNGFVNELHWKTLGLIAFFVTFLL
ncbi:Di-sulfide bridge nucleocytoplasmic transport domain-containing protein [Trichophaea hybrida]|nr:Di-sulfide bridge nucleocytoplasmic transport domain-containing protein [Trichophaea hybrida]